jgi:hypothetical protein
MTLADARLATDMAGRRIEKEVIAGEAYWCGPAADSTGSGRSLRAHERAYALPAFDELFVGYADRSAAVDPAHRARVSAFDVLGPVILLDERMAGGWKRRIAGDKVIFSTKELAPLRAAKAKAVQHALVRYARFLERPHAFEGAKA